MRLPEPPQRILVIQKQALGDVVLTTPVLRILKKAFPSSQIDLLTNAAFAPLFSGLPSVHTVLAYPYSPQDVFGVFRFWPRVRRRRYQLVIDFQGTLTPALLCFFSGARWRLGWANVSRRWAYNLHSTANQRDEYVAIQKCRALEVIGIQEVSWQTEVAFSASDRERAREFLQSHGWPSRPWINISVKSKRQARQWMPDRFARLATMLQEKLAARVAFNYAPEEREYVAQVAALCTDQPVLLPEWPLTTFAAYLSLVDLHISYDNGAKHLAVASGTPTLALYGATDPRHWHPPVEDRHRAIVARVPCRFCGYRQCGWMICMQEIQVEDVFREAANLLKTKLVSSSSNH